jgi:hypothetical protein
MEVPCTSDGKEEVASLHGVICESFNSSADMSMTVFDI